jgi:predicted RNA-binding protein with PUA-like domain
MEKALWFFSTEPDVYPWDTVFKKKKVRWDGIRGTAARKWLRDIKTGDLILGYHSSPQKAVVCVAQAASQAYPDPKDAEWLAIDVTFVKWTKRPVPLAEMRAAAGLKMMKFVRMPRLSVSPVLPAEEAVLARLSETNFRK